MQRQNVCVVIPVYSQAISYYERVSLARCNSILGRHEIILVAPDSLDISNYFSIMSGGRVSVERFSDQYFNNGLSGYNRLLTSELFYSRFLNFDFILIYQLDAFVFHDLLDLWCQKGYDYVGAPWLHASWQKDYSNCLFYSIVSKQSFLKRQLSKLRWRIAGGPNSLSVGNGGLSLRRTQTFHYLSAQASNIAASCTANEDIFWSIFLPLHGYKIQIPTWREALKFSFDYNPGLCFKKNDLELPFGCHAWFRNDPAYIGNKNFWTPIVQRFVPDLKV